MAPVSYHRVHRIEPLFSGEVHSKGFATLQCSWEHAIAAKEESKIRLAMHALPLVMIALPFQSLSVRCRGTCQSVHNARRSDFVDVLNKHESTCSGRVVTMHVLCSAHARDRTYKENFSPAQRFLNSLSAPVLSHIALASSPTVKRASSAHPSHVKSSRQSHKLYLVSWRHRRLYM